MKERDDPGITNILNALQFSLLLFRLSKKDGMRDFSPSAKLFLAWSSLEREDASSVGKIYEILMTVISIIKLSESAFTLFLCERGYLRRQHRRWMVRWTIKS